MGDNHPVWDVYDQLRTVRLNAKYYGKRLIKYERINFTTEIIVAITSSSSAVASFAFWSTEAGSQVWKVLLGISAIIAIAKPLLNLTKRIRAYEELLSGYRLLYHDLNELKIDINQAQAYTKAHRQKFLKINEKQRTLASKSPERVENLKVLQKCQNEVLDELPVSSFS